MFIQVSIVLDYTTVDKSDLMHQHLVGKSYSVKVPMRWGTSLIN